MKKTFRVGMMLGTALLAATSTFARDHKTPDPLAAHLEKEVRRELVTLPWYSLFDSLSFRIDGETVTLTGKVTRPTLKFSAENVVNNIEGVEKVVNEIQVLPLSSVDDRLRLALYRSIYGHTALQLLSIRAVPPIHIIVENGKVTLEGMVGNQMQKNIAGVQANTVSGVFSVTNNLGVDDSK